VARSPQYVELADVLAARWAGLPPGTMVESEHQLASEFGVHRLTAREAVRELERRLVVRRIMGRGTFIAHRLDYEVRLGGVPSFHRIVEAGGHVPSVRVLGCEWRGRGAHRSFVVERVSSVDGFVAAATTEMFPAAVGHEVETSVAAGGSIRDALVDAGHDPRRGAVKVAIEMPPPLVADRLEFSSNPLLTWHVESETLDGPSGSVIHTSSSWMRPDVFAVTVRLGDDSR
jgi:DNA-binding GntR family transcriptional regulator